MTQPTKQSPTCAAPGGRRSIWCHRRGVPGGDRADAARAAAAEPAAQGDQSSLGLDRVMRRFDSRVFGSGDRGSPRLRIPARTAPGRARPDRQRLYLAGWHRHDPRDGGERCARRSTTRGRRDARAGCRACEPVTRADGTQILVPIMSLRGTFDYVETDQLQLTRLPYERECVAMYVILPEEEVGLGGLLAHLTAANWLSWLGALSRRQGGIGLPRFRITYEA